MIKKVRNDSAIVIFSGGQDSTTCLYWAKKRFKKLYALTLRYGQQHDCEIDQARLICEKENIEQKIIQLDFFKELIQSNLTQQGADFKGKHDAFEELPSSFVPMRNQIFLTLAYGWATTLKTNHVITGVCEADYSGYYDCRDDFVKGFQSFTNYAYHLNIQIHTPLMFLSKAEIFKLAKDNDGLDCVIKDSHTCYHGERTELHSWGYGCGKCPACLLRKKGWEEFIKMEEELNG